MGALRASGLGAIALVGVLTAGCGSGTATDTASTASGIVLGTVPGTMPDAPAEQPTTPPASPTLGQAGVIDPTADLDIDDQRGDGSQVVIESLATSLTGVTLVITDRKGRTVGTATVTPGVQPVTVELQVPLARSQELRGALMAPGEAGMLVDDEGEAVEEDFDYVIG